MTFALARCRGPLRALITGFLLTAGIGLCVSALQVHASIGLTPDAVAEAIAGPPPSDSGTAEEDLFSEVPSTGKSYGSMLQTAHTHTLAMPMLYAMLGTIFLGTALSDRAKSLILALTFLALAADLGGLWLTRYAARGFAYWNIASGTALLCLGGLLIARSLWDLWLAGPPENSTS